MIFVVTVRGKDNSEKSIFSDTSYIGLKKEFKNKEGDDTDHVIDISNIKESKKEIVIHMASRYLYRFSKYKSNKKHNNKLIIYDKDASSITRDCVERQKYIVYAKNLINEPANIATPEYICKKVKKDLMKGVNVKVYNEKDMQKKGLNLVNAVGQGSEHKQKFLVMEYMGKTSGKTICLCGKGVTFDAGGTNIKTGKGNSYEMKADKTGGCIVIGLIKYFSEIGAAVNLIGIVPLVENVVSGSAVMPGDIIRSYSGKTVEILNTDAEGRLILADALSYAGKYKPDYIFDFATLTGWASRLHCDTSAIFFSPNHKLHKMIDEIGEAIGERTWGMPKWLDYMEYCHSKVADLKNYDLTVDGCSSGGGYMATMFLAHFVPQKALHNWVHFDICNNVDNHIMNANTMNLAIHLIKRLT